MKPKLLFHGRKRGVRRSSLLVVDEQMCTELAAVVSFGKNNVANVNLKPENQAFRVR